jgi:hypothetical protein
MVVSYMRILFSKFIDLKTGSHHLLIAGTLEKELIKVKKSIHG